MSHRRSSRNNTKQGKTAAKKADVFALDWQLKPRIEPEEIYLLFHFQQYTGETDSYDTREPWTVQSMRTPNQGKGICKS